MGEKCKSTSPSEIQVKNQRKTMGKLVTITQLEKDEQIVDIWHKVRFTHSGIHTMRNNADRITESAK